MIIENENFQFTDSEPSDDDYKEDNSIDSDSDYLSDIDFDNFEQQKIQWT
jgi:hypothetical protein